MSHRGWFVVILATLFVALSSRQAAAIGRDGQGRIELSGGPTWIADNPLTQNARAAGYDIEQSYTVGPMGLGTFGYWFDQHFELSLEGGYQHDSYGVRGKKDLTLDSEFLMATIRWAFIGGYNFWPYLGASFGYSFNRVSAPFTPPWNSWTAVGYGEAAEPRPWASISRIALGSRSSCATRWPCWKRSSPPR